MTQLVLPSVKYKKSYLTALKEFHKERRNKDYNYEEILNNFKGFVKKLKNRAKGIGLKKGYVPDTIFWIVDRNKFIGRISVRHRLTKKLRKYGGHIGCEIRPSERKKGYGKRALKLVLSKLKTLGIKKALITCDSTNIGSRKIIESNGGVFINEIPQGRKNPKLRRYYINI